MLKTCKPDGFLHWWSQGWRILALQLKLNLNPWVNKIYTAEPFSSPSAHNHIHNGGLAACVQYSVHCFVGGAGGGGGVRATAQVFVTETNVKK